MIMKKVKLRKMKKIIMRKRKRLKNYTTLRMEI